MLTRLIAFTLGAATLFAPQAFAQMAPPAAMQNLASSADVQALIAKAKAAYKDGQVSVNEPILKLAPYTVGLEYRVLPSNAAVHEKEDELFYIIEGTGTLTVGGTLNGKTISGGTDVHLSKGDFYIVPENTPHMVTPVGGILVDMSLHIPGAAPAP